MSVIEPHDCTSSSASLVTPVSLSPPADRNLAFPNADSPETSRPPFLFAVGSPRRIGESLRSAAATHFPDAVDRIVRESKSLSRNPNVDANGDDDESDAAKHPRPSGLSQEASEVTPHGGDDASTMPSSASNFRSDSFSSSASFANSAGSATLTGAPPIPPAEPPKPRSRSIFASLLDSAAVSKKDDGIKVNASFFHVGSPSVEIPRKVFRFKSCIIGECGSGKSTFHHCFSHSMLKTLPDVAPSLSSGSSTFYFKSQTKRERLDMLVVDAGPSPLQAGLSHIFEHTNLFLLTIALTGVKQRTSKRFLSFGNEPSAIVHAQDKRIIESYIAKIASLHYPGGPPPLFVLVGTHKDILTDQTTSAVETVLRELNLVVQSQLRLLPNPPRFIGCYAVSCTDHSCVSENRNSAKTIADLWQFLCELCIKEASQRRMLAAEPIVTSEGLRAALPQSSKPWDQFDDISSSATIDAPLARSSFPSTIELHRISERLVTFVRRAKTELNFVIVHVSTLRQVAFSLGVFSKVHFDAVLECLARDGEVLLLHQQPKHIGGREDYIVLWPHIAHRTVSSLIKYQSTLCYPVSDRGKLLPGIDAEACARADPKCGASKGYFSPKLLVCLSRALPQIRRNFVERAETFALLLLLVDFAFQRRVAKPRERGAEGVRSRPRATSSAPTATGSFTSVPNTDYDSEANNVPDSGSDVSLRSPKKTPPHRPATPPGHSNKGLLLDPASVQQKSRAQRSSHDAVQYIVPSLIQHYIPHSVTDIFAQRLFRVNANVLMDDRGPLLIQRVIVVQACPQDFFSALVCRLGPFVVPSSRVYSDAVWIHRSRRLELDSDASDSEEYSECDNEHGSDAGAYDAGSRGAKRMTRCLVHFSAQATAQTPSGIVSEVRFYFVSTEERLAMANFVVSVLGVACQLLRVKYPAVQWKVSNQSSCTACGGTENETPFESSFRELDEQFSEVDE